MFDGPMIVVKFLRGTKDRNTVWENGSRDEILVYLEKNRFGDTFHTSLGQKLDLYGCKTGTKHGRWLWTSDQRSNYKFLYGHDSLDRRKLK